jgi:hypothetical protein
VGQAQERWLRITTAFAAREGTTPTPGGLCTACAEVLAVNAASIALMGNGRTPAVTYASSTQAERLEELQFRLGIGPTFDAYRRGVSIVESDLVGRPAARWLGFIGPAVDNGIEAVFAFPLQVGAARLGTLTLYQSEPGPLDDDTYADALVMADVVTRALLIMEAGMFNGALADELRDDGAYRAEIHQASGMLSVQLNIDVGEALARLRARAIADDTTVAHLAAAVIARRVRVES